MSSSSSSSYYYLPYPVIRKQQHFLSLIEQSKQSSDSDCNPPHVLCLQMTLGHEFGAGAACLKCKDKCEGFELHFWRFVQLLSSSIELTQKQV